MMELHLTGHSITPLKIIDKPACIAVVVSSVGYLLQQDPYQINSLSKELYL